MIQQLKIMDIIKLNTRFKLEKSLFNGERDDVGLFCIYERSNQLF